jgi:hypothetical protein
MSTPPTTEALQQQVAALEAELTRLRPIEAAAREAYAFFAGRRPGFAATYPRDVIVAAFEPGAAQRSKPSRSPKRRKK